MADWHGFGRANDDTWTPLRRHCLSSLLENDVGVKRPLTTQNRLLAAVQPPRTCIFIWLFQLNENGIFITMPRSISKINCPSQNASYFIIYKRIKGNLQSIYKLQKPVKFFGIRRKAQQLFCSVMEAAILDELQTVCKLYHSVRNYMNGRNSLITFRNC